MQARVGDKFILANYALQADRAANRVHLTLYWQSAAPSDTDYTVFVHLLDSSGNIVAQRDAPPRDGKYPTSIWDVGEIVKDEYDLAIPADARGPFSLAIGMYSPLTQKRLPIGNSDHLDHQFRILDFGFMRLPSNRKIQNQQLKMELSRALRIQSKEIVAFVGGGGKTSALFCLADELIASASGW